MTALVMDGVTLTQDVAAELLTLSPDVPDAAKALDAMSNDDVMAAMHLILVAHHCDVVECRDEWVQRYIEDPSYTAARMSRCVVIAARLLDVTP